MVTQNAQVPAAIPGQQGDTLAAYAAHSTYGALPTEVADRVKLIVFDQLACGLVGSELPAAKAVARYVAGYGGTEEAVAFGLPQRCPAPLAALANGTAGHADEFDSVHSTPDFLGTGHPAAVIVHAAAAMSERQSSSGREFANAVSVGYDVGSRAVSAVGGLVVLKAEHGLYGGAMYSLGAAFAAARLMELEERQHLYAAAHAISKSTSFRTFFGEQRHMSKALVEGQAAFAGVSAALLTAAGVEAHPNIFEAPGGLLETWGAQGREHELTAGLGVEYGVMGSNFKFYSAGYPIHACVEGALDLLAENNFSVADVERIIVRMPATAADVVNNRPIPTINLQHMLAVALVAGRLGFDEAHSATFRDDARVHRLQSLVEIIPDPSYEPTQPRGATVLIDVDGTTLDRRIEHPRGHRFREPAPYWPELKEKWEELLVRRIGTQRFNEYLNACMELETVDSMRDVIKLLVSSR